MIDQKTLYINIFAPSLLWHCIYSASILDCGPVSCLQNVLATVDIVDPEGQMSAQRPLMHTSATPYCSV